MSTTTSPPTRARSSGFAALLVAAGILFSRIFGLIRQRALAHYLGISDAADAFNAAFKIPNLLQNLFGEGVLSASFVPVYAGLLARGEKEEASRVASVVAAILALVTSILVVAGVFATPLLIDLIAPGFTGPKRDLTIRLVQILFPGTGLLVLSAWCLGVLNSHRWFLLSYSAPVAWNIAIIAALFLNSTSQPNQLAAIACWGSVVGSALQFGVQLPFAIRLLGRFRPQIESTSSNVRAVLTNLGPVIMGRGVVQLSAFIDTLLASLLVNGSVAALSNAQVLYTLPISLFGMSVSAAELPEMSSELGEANVVAAALRIRLEAGLRRIAFFIVPSSMAFVALGDVIVGAVYQTGRFNRADTVWVWGILAGSSVGMLASTMGRLSASVYYAQRDTKTPLRFAIVRVIVTTVLGYLFAIPLPRWLGIDPRWGVAGLTASAGIAGWVEYLLLRRGLRTRIGATHVSLSYMAKLWISALVAAGIALVIKYFAGLHHPILIAAITLVPYGVIYFTATATFEIAESLSIFAKIAGKLKRR